MALELVRAVHIERIVRADDEQPTGADRGQVDRAHDREVDADRDRLALGGEPRQHRRLEALNGDDDVALQ